MRQAEAMSLHTLMSKCAIGSHALIGSGVGGVGGAGEVVVSVLGSVLVGLRIGGSGEDSGMESLITKQPSKISIRTKRDIGRSKTYE